MDYIRNLLWMLFRNIKESPTLLTSKNIWCSLGFHKMSRGFGWSLNKRTDVCLKCDYSVDYTDKLGLRILTSQIAKLEKKKNENK